MPSGAAGMSQFIFTLAHSLILTFHSGHTAKRLEYAPKHLEHDPEDWDHDPKRLYHDPKD
jgi:hypothetical protein